MKLNNHRVLGIRQEFIVRIVVLGVAINGLFIIAGTLFSVVVFRQRFHFSNVPTGVSLITGLTLIYLSSLLARRKSAAWLLAIPVYAFILAVNLSGLVFRSGHPSIENYLRNILLPALVISGLIFTRKQFTVKSDARSFAASIRFIVLVFVISLLYGIIGFHLLDAHDFHQKLTWGRSIQRTIDQFNFTTNHPLIPYTHRARIFLDSLSIISIGSLAYAMASLFQPIKARFVDQAHNRAIMRSLLHNYPANSEDFFKLWPHDKVYFINYERSAGLAFHVSRGVALVIGDPVGDLEVFPALLKGFDELCYVNDWSPSYIHTLPVYNELYKNHGLTVQKLGEEAIVDVQHFNASVANNKYFRNIRNKVERAGYSTEVLLPPHRSDVVGRLRQISNEWLQAPGREERGLIMGYFSNSYVQQCPLLVAKDQNGTIQAFLNQIHSFDSSEANFDMLRHTKNCVGNINDYLMLKFIEHVSSTGFERLNLGLCPLSGLDKQEVKEDRTLIDNILSFAYSNGDRLYSFSGLHRFKAKYEPSWDSRYIVYRGGIPGFTKTITSLNKAWKVRFHI